MIDICTVVFEPELDSLRRQARSIDLYCRDIGINAIYVMVNDTSSVDPLWYGRFADRVHIYYQSQLGHDWSDNGWVAQQVLKMLGAGMSDNEWCMIVDAKTLFVRHIDPDRIFKQGRAATGTLPVFPVFEASKTITEKLWDIELPAQLGPGGVPFLVEPDMVRDMITEIYRRTGQSFADFFQQQGRLTEFILYSGYVWFRDGTFDRRYHYQREIQPCNICHSEVNQFNTKLKTMNDPKTLTVSIHRNAWSQLSALQQQLYYDLLASRGIL